MKKAMVLGMVIWLGFVGLAFAAGEDLTFYSPVTASYKDESMLYNEVQDVTKIVSKMVRVTGEAYFYVTEYRNWAWGWTDFGSSQLSATLYSNEGELLIDCYSIGANWTENDWKISTDRFHSVMSCSFGDWDGGGVLDLSGSFNEKTRILKATGKFTGVYGGSIITSTIVFTFMEM